MVWTTLGLSVELRAKSGPLAGYRNEKCIPAWAGQSPFALGGRQGHSPPGL